MSFFPLKFPVSTEERAQRRRLLISDAFALFTLFLVTAALAVLTNYLYESYAFHQTALAQRWLSRGEADLQNGNPNAAIDALHSALAYAPDQRSIEIKLAEALASAGRIQEATSYFNTLSESEPGNGMINLQLARLAARQGNESLALEYYEQSISGTWEGDGYVRRREVRMELIGYLISRNRYDRARNELLVASGNAPAGDTDFLLKVAHMMEQAQDPGDALHLYRSILQHHPSSLEALEGAGRSAFQMGRYLAARQYLERALSSTEAARATSGTRYQSVDMLRDSVHILDLYPSSQLSLRALGTRILADRQIAQARFAGCSANSSADNTAAGSAATVETAPPAGEAQGHAVAKTLRGLASRFERQPAEPAAASSAPPAQPAVDPLQALAARWGQQPKKLTLAQLENDPDLAQAEIQLIYDTEKVAAQVCGRPTGEDALLLKIAEAPEAVEQQ